MKEITLPSRYLPLEKIPDITSNWEVITKAVRPEFEHDANIERAQRALSVGLNDAAINYFWNLTIFDLYTKIMAYGVEYFSSAINWSGKPLRTVDDLKEVKDYEIINGAHTLSIIPDEAFFYLQQCREIRNHFSTAHYPMGEIDILETFNFIKNCIKYGLTHDLPAPGIQIKDLIQRLSLEKLNKGEEILEMINQQAQKVKGPILHSFFKSYIQQGCDANLKHNIRLLAPSLWEGTSDDVKTAIAHKYASIKDMKDSDTETEALDFLKLVNGVSFIPETYRDILFTKSAKRLIDAHFDWDNFYSEPGYARELRNLGSEIPTTSLRTYVKAIVLSFIGNGYGEAREAQKYNRVMIENLNPSGIILLFDLLEHDSQIISELASFKPAARVKILMEIIKDKSIQPESKALYDYLCKVDSTTIKHHYYKKYINLIASE